jgi:hypothetical protein
MELELTRAFLKSLFLGIALFLKMFLFTLIVEQKEH